MKIDLKKRTLKQIINEQLKPIIRKIDEESYYPKEFLSAVGQAGFFTSSNLLKEDIRCREIYLIEETARYCMTSAFTLWCHLAALSSVRLSNNPFVKNELLPLLESGEVLGGTGLSNALKYYAGVEPIRLRAERTDGGYMISGSLSSVSNLDVDHWFVIIASLNKQRIMCMIPVKIKGLELKSKTNFVGLNGSATYSCFFDNVFVPDRWIINEQADEFIQVVRPTLVLYQIPLGIGVSGASIESIEESHSKDVDVNHHVIPQLSELMNDIEFIRKRTYEHAQSMELTVIFKEILLTRLEIAKLTPKIVHKDMLYFGSPAYMQGSASFRRLKEAYFLVNLSPTVKQLENYKIKLNK